MENIYTLSYMNHIEKYGVFIIFSHVYSIISNKKMSFVMFIKSELEQNIKIK